MLYFLVKIQKILDNKKTVGIMLINQKVTRSCLQGARGCCERVAGGCEIGADGILLKIINSVQVSPPYRAAPC